MKRIGLLTCILLLSYESWACWCIGPKPLTKDILKRYPYVALVRVTGLEPFVSPGERPDNSLTAKFTVEIIENFKNPLPKELLVESHMSSCDIGLRANQIWVIFAKKSGEYAQVYACDYSVHYRGEQPVREYENLRSQSAEELLNTLRQLTGKPIKATDGRIEKFYANGRRALLTTYRNKGRDEERTVWHANGRLWGKEFYKNGVKNGSATWWNANGTPRSAETFVAGVAVDTSRYWHQTDVDTAFYPMTSLTKQDRDSILRFYTHPRLEFIKIADRQGKLLNSRNYDRNGRLVDETVGVPKTGVECRTAYDKQGNVNFLLVTRAVPTPNSEPTQEPVYKMEYQPDGSRQIAYYDLKGRLTRWVSVKNGVETVLEEKRYPD